MEKMNSKIILFVLLLHTSTSTFGMGLFTQNSLSKNQHDMTTLPPFLGQKQVDIHTYSDNRTAQYSGGYFLKDQIFNKYEETLSPEEFLRFKTWYFSMLFFNSQRVFMDNADSSDQECQGDGLTCYNKEGEFPVDGVAKGHEFLAPKKFIDITISDILNLHKIVLSKESVDKLHTKDPQNSENSKDGQLGKFRWQAMFWRMGTQPKDLYTQCKDLELPFHDWKTSTSPETYTELNDVNPYTSKFVNFIYYVTLSQWRDFEERLLPSTIELIKKTEEELLSMGVSIDNKYGKNALDALPFKTKTQNGKFVYRKFVHDLVMSLLVETKSMLAEAKTNDDIILIAAKFYRDFVSIHPFTNGNGRLSRLLVAKLLNDYNIATPILIYPDFDATFSYIDLFHVMKDSITLSQNFHQNLKFSANNNLFWGLASPLLTKADLVNPVPINGQYFMTWVYSQPHKNLLFSTLLDNYAQYIQNMVSPTDSVTHLPKPHALMAPPTYYLAFKNTSLHQNAFFLKRKAYYEERSVVHVKFFSSHLSPKDLLQMVKPQPKSSRKERNHLAKTFHLFNTQIANMTLLDPNYLDPKLDLERVTLYKGNNPPCTTHHPSYLEIIAKLPRYGKIHWQDHIDLIGGIDPESIDEIRYCHPEGKSAHLTVLKRTNFKFFELSQFRGKKLISKEDLQ